MKDPAVREQQIGVRTEHIPHALLPYRQWVCWRYVDRGPGRKPDKRPLNPHSLHNAGVHWPNTWSTLEQACMAYWAHRDDIAGIGFVLTPDDPFVGVDLDHCIQQGEISEDAQQIVAALDSYTEISPSGAGIRILAACPEFASNMRQPDLEVYSHSRFLTVTGRLLDGTPATVSSVDADAIQALLSEQAATAPTPLQQPANLTHGELDTSDLWHRIFAHDRFGEQHRQRFSGDTSLDGGDHSLTVIRLLNCLARWTHGDAVQMRSMMLMSPLANEKWSRKRGQVDWLDYQIADAIRYIKAKI